MALKQETKQKIVDALAEAILDNAMFRSLIASRASGALDLSHFALRMRGDGTIQVVLCPEDEPGACPIEEVD